jgi:hypothetical protein
MPYLLNFITRKGTLLTNDHTVLISHTATGILTSLTGVYGDRMGQPVSNSFRYFNPDGTTNPEVSFAYWTAPLFDPSTTTPTDQTPHMIDSRGKTAPAPWVPYTRAGCDVGMVATANTILENIAIDIPTVFGADSPQAAEVKSNPAQAFADFVGIGVHCAQGRFVCSAANGGVADLLPDEPGGYDGYLGLFGHTYVAPLISPDGPLTDLTDKVIKDAAGNIGFPGFDGMSAAVSLAYVAAMQEAGIPVTYAYISDAHDKHPSGPAYGPGEAGYVAALRSYDEAFAAFFERLAAAGIDESNTLFVFTVDEGDHFVGGPPSPVDCDGVTTPCTYSQIGEINANLAGLLATEQHNTTPFTVHSDSAPTLYITGNPTRTDPVTRQLERDVSTLTAVNPITGATDTLTVALADAVEMQLLHMITADPMRTPTFTMFAKPEYFLFAGAPNCSSPCVTVQPRFAWNHGDNAPDIAQTWLGLVGPGVRGGGVNGQVWSDHTDVRPTMLVLLGLRDDYAHDGRVLSEILHDWTIPQPLRTHRQTLIQLAQVYKELNAPFGELGRNSLVVSTSALESDSAGDATYTDLESQIVSWTKQRDELTERMGALLEGVAFDGQEIDEQQAKLLIDQGKDLLALVRSVVENFGDAIVP